MILALDVSFASTTATGGGDSISSFDGLAMAATGVIASMMINHFLTQTAVKYNQILQSNSVFRSHPIPINIPLMMVNLDNQLDEV